MRYKHATEGNSLVLPLVDKLLKCFFERIAKLLILLEGLSQHDVQLRLHFQQHGHHILVLQHSMQSR